MKLSLRNATIWTAFAALLVPVLVSTSCKNPERRSAEQMMGRLLTNKGVKDIKFQSFVTDPSVPDKAYLSLIATWPFADSSGKLQTERLGFVVRKQGKVWMLDRDSKFTTDTSEARALLNGAKR